MRHPPFTLFALLLVALPTLAGEYNAVLDIGAPAPAWTKLPGTDGKEHSFDEFAGREVLVVVFTCNSCPVAVDYEARILAFAKKYDTANPKSRVALVAINVNTKEPDRLPKMMEHAKQAGFTFPYLFDESQKIAKQYGAEYTPEFFVLNKERKVAYMGAMDDRNKAEDVKERFLEVAVDAILAGKEPDRTETLGRGCRIQYNRGKR